MLINTKNFQAVAKTIALAVDDMAANLEILTKNNKLNLSVTNGEYYCRCCFNIESAEETRAVVDAKLFLELINSITTESFEFLVDSNVLKIKAGKSSYKLPMIFENDKLMELPVIFISNKTVEMPVNNDILQSIVTVNGQEVKKTKNMTSINELQKLYYITENGAFNFTTGATLNRFTLEKPVKMLLNDRIVKLFKLFRSDVNFSLGYDPISDNKIQTKISLETADTYLAAVITNDDLLLSKVQGPCEATQKFINEKYDYSLVVSATQLSAAISRLLMFTKNSFEKTSVYSIPATININGNEMTIIDNQENSEVIQIENTILNETPYSLGLNLIDLKLVLDSCKIEHITMNCGNHKSVIITRGEISHLLPEVTV